MVKADGKSAFAVLTYDNKTAQDRLSKLLPKQLYFAAIAIQKVESGNVACFVAVRTRGLTQQVGLQWRHRRRV